MRQPTSVEYWIEAEEEDVVRDMSFGQFLMNGSGLLPMRNLYRRLKGDRRPFTCEDFLDELGDMKLLRNEWEPVDYAGALEPDVGFHVEVEETEEEPEVDKQMLAFAPSRVRDLVALTYLPDENIALVRAPAMLKEGELDDIYRVHFVGRLLDVIRKRELHVLYGMERVNDLLDRAGYYPCLYNRAVFEQLSHIAAGHPIPIADTDDYFWPQNWTAKLPPLRHLPEEELSAVNIREAQLRAEWMCIMSAFKEVVFTESLFH